MAAATGRRMVRVLAMIVLAAAVLGTVVVFLLGGSEVSSTEVQTRDADIPIDATTEDADPPTTATAGSADNQTDDDQTADDQTADDSSAGGGAVTPTATTAEESVGGTTLSERPPGCIPVRGHRAFMFTSDVRWGTPICLLVGDFQTVAIRNGSGSGSVAFNWLGEPVRLGPYDTAQLRVGAGRSLPPNESGVGDRSTWMPDIYFVSRDLAPGANHQLDAPDAFGPVAVGMTLAEATTALGHPIEVEVDLYLTDGIASGALINGPSLWEAYLNADPYSPAFVVEGDGSDTSRIVRIAQSNEEFVGCFAEREVDPDICGWTDSLPHLSMNGYVNPLEVLASGWFNYEETAPTLTYYFARSEPISGAAVQRCWDLAVRDDLGSELVDEFSYVFGRAVDLEIQLAVIEALFHCVEPEDIHRELLSITALRWEKGEAKARPVDRDHPCWTDHYSDGFDSFQSDWLRSIMTGEHPVWTLACREEFLRNP